MALLIFIYAYRIDTNVERLMPCLKKLNSHLKNILSSNNKFKQQRTFKSKQQSMTSSRCKYNALYNLSSAISNKLFFIDVFNWKFVYLFLLASLE